MTEYRKSLYAVCMGAIRPEGAAPPAAPVSKKRKDDAPPAAAKVAKTEEAGKTADVPEVAIGHRVGVAQEPPWARNPDCLSP